VNSRIMKTSSLFVRLVKLVHELAAIRRYFEVCLHKFKYEIQLHENKFSPWNAYLKISISHMWNF
jgi:hypothetical protein